MTSPVVAPSSHNGHGKLSLVRILEVVASAAIVGSIAVYSSQKVNEERLNAFTAIVQENSQTLKNLEQASIDLRIEMARTEASSVLMQNMSDILNKHERLFETIWPRLRDQSSRLDRIETKLDLTRPARETEIPLK